MAKKNINLSLINLQEEYHSDMLVEILNMRHADIIRSIRSMEKQLDVNAELRSLWKSITYIDTQGKERPKYILTKKGLLLLASKFNDNLRLALIERFEFLEADRLRTQQILAERAWDVSDKYDLVRTWK